MQKKSISIYNMPYLGHVLKYVSWRLLKRRCTQHWTAAFWSRQPGYFKWLIGWILKLENIVIIDFHRYRMNTHFIMFACRKCEPQKLSHNKNKLTNMRLLDLSENLNFLSNWTKCLIISGTFSLSIMFTKIRNTKSQTCGLSRKWLRRFKRASITISLEQK